MSDNSVKIILEAVDKASGAFETFKKNATGAFSSIQSSLSIIKLDSIVNLGQKAIQAGEQIYNFGKGVASSLNDISRQAELIGVTTTEYQKLSYAAKMSDVSNESLRLGMKGLSLSMAEFVQGAGNGYDVLRALGLSAVDAEGKQKPLNQMFVEIADKFSAYADGAAKVDYANKLMGRSGMELITLFNKGKQGIASYGEELVRMGGLIDENIVKKGAAAEDTFKNIDVQITAMKANMAPAVGIFAEFGESITRYLVPGFEKLGERLGAIGKIDPPQWVKDWVKGFVVPAKPQVPEKIEPPEPGWIKKWVKQFDELEHSFTQLGVESQASLAKVAQSADVYVGVIQAAFDKGKASAVDLKNALAAATGAWQKLIPPDTTQKVTDVWMEYDKAVRQIAEDDPTRGAKVSALIDQVMKQIKAVEGPTIGELKASLSEYRIQGQGIIQQLQAWIDQNPIRAAVDVKEFSRLDDAFNSLKSKIESTPIKINVDASALGGGGGGLYASNAGMVSGAFADQNFDVKLKFWGEASPVRPLSETIQEILSQFGGLENAMTGMNALINFSELSMQFRGLQDQLQQVRDIAQSYQQMYTAAPHVSLYSPTAGYYLDPAVGNQLEKMKSNIMSQMGLTQMKMMMEILQGFGGSFQTGGTVPKTGLYLLHKYERVETPNQVSMSSGPFIFNISGNDPKATANEIEKILKYNLSGSLRDTIKTIR